MTDEGDKDLLSVVSDVDGDRKLNSVEQRMRNMAFQQSSRNSACASDETLPGCNSCLTPSASANCNDPFCVNEICERQGQEHCCLDSWSEDCVFAAQEACVTQVIPIYDEYCPLGFVCDDSLRFKANCSEIRQIPIDLRFGDVFGGMYCADNSTSMQNCGLGSFCPDPFTKKSCPAGSFCPEKTVLPWIDCPTCTEGAKAIKINSGGPGFIAFCTLAILLLVWTVCRRFCSRCSKRINGIVAQRMRRAKSLILQSVEFRMTRTKKYEQARLQRLESKLAVIASRLQESGKTIELGEEEKKSDALLPCNANTLYDTLDVNGDGQLEYYSELNEILDFDEHELKMFIERMNNAGIDTGDSKDVDLTFVSRPVFIRHFLPVLETVLSMKITPDDAAAIYDEILEATGKPAVTEKMLYDSPVADNLSDHQIFCFIKFLRDNGADDEELGFNTKRGAFLCPAQGAGNINIRREAFIEFYPVFLKQLIATSEDQKVASNVFHGVDICFKNLCLQIPVGENIINAVDDVTGRIRAKTLTAIMGGSGAGKTSLLNALCGRAHYGTALGEIYINGHKTTIDKISGVFGFVPQDDIVYAELTVRENFLYAGKLRLPKDTPLSEIQDLAELILADLGLTRVADSLVGDVKRRGVSGGEKKRVNIGLELMARPACLFLDEPTSGLDASSALLVMGSLKQLVATQGVTVVSVIHQPREFIFQMFDSLFLLGEGGKIAYHGPTDKVHDYFRNLEYVLPAGESLANWLIDISSGQIHPQPEIAATKALEEKQKKKKKRSKNGKLKTTKKTKKTKALEGRKKAPTRRSSLALTVVGTSGVATGQVKLATEDAGIRRQWLYDEWDYYFSNLTPKDSAQYEVPKQQHLPDIPIKQPFLVQLKHQISREHRVAWRNVNAMLIDTAFLLVFVIIITLLTGPPELTRTVFTSLEFESLVTLNPISLSKMTPELFKYARSTEFEYPTYLSVIVCVLMGLQGVKVLTSKRIEFFREASSGYNTNAYFLAVNLISTIELSGVIILAALTSAFLRAPVASWWSYIVHFLVLTWVSLSWGFLFAWVFPVANVTVITGIYMAFGSLMLCGSIAPFTYRTIYKSEIKEHISAWLSPNRFFVEGLTVGEYRTLPAQSGFTVDDASVNFDRDKTMMRRAFGYAMHDPNATIRSLNGYYNGILPAIFVGITIRYLAFLAMHVCHRDQQTKKPFLFQLKYDRRTQLAVLLNVSILIGLVALTTFLYTNDIDPAYDYYGF